MDSSTEQLEPRKDYVYPIKPDDIATINSGELDEVVFYPKKTLINIGTVQVILNKLKDEEEMKNGVSEEALAHVITESGIKMMKVIDAMRTGYYRILLRVETPFRRRGIRASVFASIDGVNNQYVGGLFNLSEDEELTEHHSETYKADESDTKGTILECYGIEKIDEANPYELMVRNDPEALSKLGMRFEILQGGESQQ